jgi:hypothetical protein
MTRLASIAASGIANVMLLMAAAAIAQDTPLPLPPQQAPAEFARPIVGGHHVQPNASELQTLSVQQPTRRLAPEPELSPITRELLEDTLTAPGNHQ